ncbi:MAG TPA: hypothetical protein VK986_26935 [Tepidisphaeraceae bacterium]|nr:hypothetical protein [Tepidisphaeraceae bacterium]
MPRASLLLLALTLIGCDSDPPATHVTPATLPGTTVLPRVRADRITPLPAGRLTHVAADGVSHLFWVQETDRPDATPPRQLIFALPDGGIPAPTAIDNETAAAIVAQAQGQTGEKVPGQIQSLTSGPDGQLYFYFAGGTRREVRAGVGAFAPGSREVRLIADTAALKSLTNMGDGLGLARGSVVRSGDRVWVWVRHQDAAVLLALDPRAAGAKLYRPFDQPAGEGAADLQLTSDRDDLTSAADGSILYLDRPGSRVWRINPKGAATVAADLTGLPADMPAPVIDARGRLLTIAPAGRTFGDPAVPDEISATLARNNPATTTVYPALILIDTTGHRTLVGRDKWDVAPGLKVTGWAPPRLFIDRGALVAYDRAAGDLIRLRLD